jgi:hypothetical protein
MSAAAANLNPAQDLLSLAYPCGHLESGLLSVLLTNLLSRVNVKRNKAAINQSLGMKKRDPAIAGWRKLPSSRRNGGWVQHCGGFAPRPCTNTSLQSWLGARGLPMLRQQGTKRMPSQERAHQGATGGVPTKSFRGLFLQSAQKCFCSHPGRRQSLAQRI